MKYLQYVMAPALICSFVFATPVASARIMLGDEGRVSRRGLEKMVFQRMQEETSFESYQEKIRRMQTEKSLKEAHRRWHGDSPVATYLPSDREKPQQLLKDEVEENRKNNFVKRATTSALRRNARNITALEKEASPCVSVLWRNRFRCERLLKSNQLTDRFLRAFGVDKNGINIYERNISDNPQRGRIKVKKDTASNPCLHVHPRINARCNVLFRENKLTNDIRERFGIPEEDIFEDSVELEPMLEEVDIIEDLSSDEMIEVPE